jgi:hypothetical protein
VALPSSPSIHFSLLAIDSILSDELQKKTSTSRKEIKPETTAYKILR